MSASHSEVYRVLRAQSGDREALDLLLRGIQEPIYRYLCGITQDATLAEDVLQDTFLLVIRKLRWLRHPEYFRSWVYRIGSRVAFRRLGQERRRRWVDLDESLLQARLAPDGWELEPELAADLPRLVARVSPASRAVLLLHYQGGLSLPEVADVLGISLGTTKSRLAYGLTLLRRKLAAEPGPLSGTKGVDHATEG